MPDAIDQFNREHNLVRGLTHDRRVDSMRALREFEALAGKPILEAGAGELQSYLATLVERGYAPTTVRKYRNLIRPFYSWAWRGGLVSAETLLRVKAVELPRGALGGKPNPYAREQVARLWRELERDFPFLPNDYYLQRFANGTSRFGRIRAHSMRLQMEAIVGLALFAGLRRDEIYRARVDDIHYENAYIVVPGAAKNPEAEQRTRFIPWTTPAMRDMIRDWLDFREWLEPEHDRVWLALHNNSWWRSRMSFKRFNSLLSKRGWSYHRLRHTCATELLRAGYSIVEVQEILGHARLEQTRRYVELLPDQLVRTAKKLEPSLSIALSPRHVKEADADAA